MTSVAGKKPQDIYDAGASQAAAIEQAASEHMNKEGSLATKQADKIDADVSIKLEDKSDDIVAELKGTKTAYLQQLQRTIDTEVRETNAHLAQVSKDLESLSTRLKRQIASLKSSHSEDVKTLTDNLSEQFLGALERTQRDLEKTNFDANSRLRVKGNSSVTVVQQKLDQSLWETRGEERQYNSVFFKNFMKKANNIDTHFSGLMQELSEDFEKHNKILQTQAEKTDAELKKEAESLAKQIKTQETKYEREITDFFNHESVEHSNRLDNSLNMITHELSTMHDVTTSKLSEQTQTLSTELLKASSDVKSALNEQCLDLTTHLTRSMTNFKVRLNERTEHSQNMKDGLEEEKHKLFADLKTELTNIKEGFETNLEKMVIAAVEKVVKVGQDAEENITAANERCATDLEKVGFAAKKDIDETVYRFLDVIADQRGKALEEITKAAGPNGRDDISGQHKPHSSAGSSSNRDEKSANEEESTSVKRTADNFFDEDPTGEDESPKSQTKPQESSESSAESSDDSPFDLNFINFGDAEEHSASAKEETSPFKSDPSTQDKSSSADPGNSEPRQRRRRDPDRPGFS